MGSIFISHSEKDLGLVDEIIRGLQQAGYRTWYFERDILPGTSYLVQIHDAVDQCDAVVLVVSSNSISSDQTAKEVVCAFERRKPFFPILLDMTPPQLKQRQPEWRHALGDTAMICVGPGNVSECVQRVIEGLKVRGILPEEEKILSSRSSMEGERKQVTVLFADVSGFTSISESLDPEEVHGLISECLAFLTEEVHRYEGTVTQFLGDGIMALFGAPIAHEDAPQRALHTALGIKDRIREYAAKLKPRGIDFDMHIGLNSGLVMVGKIGDDLTMEYTAMGDTVNLASRMATAAQPGVILVSENTHKLTRGYFDFLPPAEIQVKGKKETVKAYQLLGVGRAKTRLDVSVVRGLTPFVGRQNEIEQLTRCFERVKKGQGQVVGIVGEPGVGKSRLLLQMRELLPQPDCTYLEGGCLHYGEATVYLPLLDILRSYFHVNEGDNETVGRKRMSDKIDQLDPNLKPILPPLHDILSFKVDDEAYLSFDAPTRRVRIFESLRDLLVRESQHQPLVVAIEDLHWIDKTSEEFLGYLIGFLASARIMLILLYRPEYTNPWTGKTYYAQIRVDELSQDASAEMVQAILHEGKAAPELQSLILSRAAGNPLFMEELTRSLLDRGFIQRQNGHYVLTVKAADIQVPDTVQGIIGARMDRLDEGLKRTLQVASVIGREFGLRLLQTVTATGEEVKSHLFSLQDLELVYQKSLFPEPEYIFKHALTQDVAYNSLLIKRRKEIHERIGQAVEELYPERLEEFHEVLAHHYWKAENPDRAYHYLKLSGDKAAKNYAKWEGLGFYQSAIDLLKRQPNTEQNNRKGIEVRLQTSVLLTYLGYPEGSLQVLEEGERLSREIGDDNSLARFLSLLSFFFGLKGDARKGLAYAEDCFKEAEKAQDVDLMTGTGPRLCYNYMGLGEWRKVPEVATKVIDLVERTGRQSESFGQGFNVYAALHGTCGLALAQLGDFQRAEVLCEKGLRYALEIKDQYGMAWAENMYASAYCMKGDGGQAVAHAEKGIIHCEETQFVTVMGFAWLYSGYGYLLLGDLDTARERVEKGQTHNCAVGISLAMSYYYQLMTLICVESADWEPARAYANEGLQCAQTHGERQLEGILSVYLGTTLAKTETSQSHKAERLILQGIKICDDLRLSPSSAHGYLALGQLHADTGQKERAFETLNKAKVMFQEMGMSYWLARTQKALEKLEG